MFASFGKACTCLFFVLLLAGCFGGYSGETGLEVTEIMALDDEIEARLSVEKGEVFGLDMPNPSAKGHSVTGAVFDPALLTVERYLEYDDDGTPRLQYLFKAIADGTSDVIIKMRTSGGMVGIYRTARVVVGSE